MNLRLLLIVSVLLVSINLSCAKRKVPDFHIKHVLQKGKVKHYFHIKKQPTWTAVAIYDQYYSTIGWDIFETETSRRDPDEIQAYAAGYLEGSLTWKAIYTHYYNNFHNLCNGKTTACKDVQKFLKRNTKWIRRMIKKQGNRSSPWHHIKLVYKQIEGVYDGYNSVCEEDKKLTFKDMLMINFQWDVYDLFEALPKNKSEVPASVRGDTHCSAIIKLLPDYADIVIGHNAWNNYSSMVRMVKRYKLHYHTSSHSTLEVFGVAMAFSGYPGAVASNDDFYIMNSGIVSLETTNDINNNSLWDLINPETVFEPVRSLIANRLANNGRSWGEYFSLYNSGTYNNQWMIVDLNKFLPGSKPLLGLLYIIEQIPGYIRMEDQTLYFLNQTYWPSYNIPFYKDVFNISGNQDLVEKYGEWFDYDYSPRSQIFRRDHNNVTDVDSLLSLLRYNDYNNDNFSVCSNCVPERNAAYAIAARSDLNPDNGTYPFFALGHRSYGAIDAKVTSSQWAATTQLKAVCGPSTGVGLPAFQWSTSGFNESIAHVGQPDRFEFNPVHFTWAFL